MDDILGEIYVPSKYSQNISISVSWEVCSASVGGRFHLWVPVFFCRWLFAFVANHFHLQAAIFIHGQLFAFMGVSLCGSCMIGTSDEHGWWWWEEESGWVW